MRVEHHNKEAREGVGPIVMRVIISELRCDAMGANSAIKFTILLVLVSSSSTFEVISKTKDQVRLDQDLTSDV